MAENSKVFKRRLLILVVAVVLLGAAAAGFYAYRKNRIHRQFMAWRAEGMDAAAKNDSPRALDYLGRYLVRYGNDVPALKEYARARAAVPTKDGQHISDQVRVLRHILRLEPELVDERRELMKLYAKIGFSAEAYDAAVQILAKQPNDADALGVKAQKLMRDLKFAEALETSTLWCQQAPLSPEAHITHVMLLKQTQVPDAKILEHVDALLKAHANDPVFEIVAALGHGLAGQQERAAELLRAASARKLPDPDTARTLLNYLDQFHMIEESTALLEQIEQQWRDPALTLALAQRYWQTPGKLEKVVELLKDVTPQTAAEHPPLMVGLRSSALAQLKRNDEARALVNTLRARTGDTAAQAWAVVVEQMMASSFDAAAVLKACTAAAQNRAEDVILQHFRAEALARVGEKELAATTWKQVAERNRSWSMPLARLSAVLSELGRAEEAAAAGFEAVRRSPGNAIAPQVLTGALASALRLQRDQDPAQVIKAIEEIRQQAPQDEASLVMYAGVLGRAGKTDAAGKAIREALAAGYPLGEQTLLRLAAVSQQYKLGLDDELFARSEKDHGITAELALARTMRDLAAGKPEEGLAAFDKARAAAANPGAKDSLSWDLARARYLETIGHADAPAALAALATKYPNEIAAQHAVVAAHSTQKDAALIDRTINRLRALTGDDAIGWKTARARYLLDHKGDPNEAIKLLESVILTAPESLQGRLLAARAYHAAGRRAEGINELTEAVRISPEPAPIRVRLAAMLREAGDLERAQAELELIRPEDLSRAEDRRIAAELFARQGDPRRASQLLELGQDVSAMNNPQKEVMAQLYVRQQRYDEAENLYNQILASEPTVTAITQAAELQARRGKLDQARATIERLATINLPPSERAVRVAQFTFQFVDPAEGLQRMQAATSITPSDPIPWRALILTHVLLGQLDEAKAVLAKAAQAAGGWLAELNRNAALLALGNDPLLRLVVADLIQDPAASPRHATALAALQAVAGAREGKRSPEALVNTLRDISERDPAAISLQLYLAQSYAQLGRLDDAARTATVAARNAPGAVEPRQMATAFRMQLGQFAEALRFATEWRGVTPSAPLAADLAIAECNLGLNRPADAIAQLKPYVAPAPATAPGAAPATTRPATPPAVLAQVLPVYARAEKANGQRDVAPIMEPLLQQGAAGRQQWVTFALQHVEPAQAPAWLKRAQTLADAEYAAAPPTSAPAATDSPGTAPAYSVADQERVILAQAWIELSARTKDPAHEAIGREMLKTIVAKPDAPPIAYYVQASLLEKDNDLAAAEANYRRAIEKQPSFPVAQNNLAMLLSRDSAKLVEAEKLIDDALRAWPAVPALHDTRATVLAKAGRIPDAVASMGRAVQLQPTNLGYRMHRVQLLLDANQRDLAQEEFKEVKSRLPANLDSLPQDLRQRYEAQRDALEKTTASGD